MGSNYQNNDIANTYMEQNGQGGSFNLCDQGWYMPVMGNHYPAMVFSMALWGGPGIDMGWMDGVTGCGGDCNIDGSTFTMKKLQTWGLLRESQGGFGKNCSKLYFKELIMQEIKNQNQYPNCTKIKIIK